MSIWSSLTLGDVKALNGNDEGANYRAEGEPSIVIDIATAAPWHDHIRLGLLDFPTGAVNVDALLSPEMARKLRDTIDEALRKVGQ